MRQVLSVVLPFDVPTPRVPAFERACRRAEPLPLPCPDAYNGTAELYKLSHPYEGFDYVVVSHSFRIPETLLFGCGADGRADLADYPELAGEHFTRSTAEALLAEIGYAIAEEVV